MAGMNPGFAKYLADKKASKGTSPTPKKPSGVLSGAKKHSKVMTAPKNLKHGKYL